MRKKSMSFSLGNFLTTASNLGLTVPQISTLAGTLMGGSLLSKTQAALTELATLVNDPAEYNAASPGIINNVEAFSGMPPQNLPLLQSLRVFTNPLQIGQTITVIEANISAAA
jgi:hypothetical protein